MQVKISFFSFILETKNFKSFLQQILKKNFDYIFSSFLVNLVQSFFPICFYYYDCLICLNYVITSDLSITPSRKKTTLIWKKGSKP